MTFHSARYKLRFLFNQLAVVFTIGYFISVLNYSSPDLVGGTKPLLHAVGQASYLGCEFGKPDFSKIPWQFIYLINFRPASPQTQLSNYKNLFISLFERNVFYVYTSIHAP